MPDPLLWASAALLGTMINPYGIRLYSVFWDHWRERAVLRGLIIEWEQPTFTNAYQNGYWFMILFSTAGLILAIARGIAVPAEHVMAVVVFSLFASRSFRTTSYASLVAYPLSLAAWYRLSSPPWWRRARPIALGVAIGAYAWTASQIVKDPRFHNSAISLEDFGPERAANFLQIQKKELSGLRLFNPWNWGGYIDAALYPDYRAFMDGRYLFHGLLAQMSAASDQPGPWRRFLEGYKIDLALLHNDGHMIRMGTGMYWRAFTAYAMPRSQWALIYWDAQAMIFVRRSAVSAQWLKTTEFNYLRPRDLRFLGLLMVDGHVRRSDVVAEIERYEKTIGDPAESYKMRTWLAEFDKGIRSERLLKASN
jgi:hypothetical protein